jgi:Rod binding domain-containing protein
MFLGQAFRMMNNHEPVSDFGTGGSAEKMFKDLQYDEYAKEIASGEGYGLSDLVYQSLARKNTSLK